MAHPTGSVYAQPIIISYKYFLTNHISLFDISFYRLEALSLSGAGGARPTQTDLIVNGLQSLTGMSRPLWNTFLLTSVLKEVFYWSGLQSSV